MYESFYKFDQAPFRLTPDSNAFYESATHRHSLDYLRYAVLQGEGFAVVSGKSGTGKTELMHRLIEELNSDRVTHASIVTSDLDSIDLLKLVASEFGLLINARSKIALDKTLEGYFITQSMQGKRALLLIDEAHNLSDSAFSELVKLVDLQYEGKSIFQCVLLGQEMLVDKLAATDLTYVNQRIVALTHLDLLTEGDTRNYINHRLKYAGSVGELVISDDAFQLIYVYTEGNPREINSLCNRILVKTFLEESYNIDEETVRFVVDEHFFEAHPLDTQNIPNSGQLHSHLGLYRIFTSKTNCLSIVDGNLL